MAGSPQAQLHSPEHLLLSFYLSVHYVLYTVCGQLRVFLISVCVWAYFLQYWTWVHVCVLCRGIWECEVFSHRKWHQAPRHLSLNCQWHVSLVLCGSQVSRSHTDTEYFVVSNQTSGLVEGSMELEEVVLYRVRFGFGMCHLLFCLCGDCVTSLGFTAMCHRTTLYSRGNCVCARVCTRAWLGAKINTAI